MTRLSKNLLALCFIAMLSIGDSAMAAEIQLRENATVEGPFVRLADLANLYGASEAELGKLAAIELFPAPPKGTEKIVRARQVMDVLVLRGVSFSKNHLSGSSRITLASGGSESAPRRLAKPTRVMKAVDATKAKQAVYDAIASRLDQQDIGQLAPQNANQATPWQIEFQLTAEQTQHLHKSGNQFSLTGGAAPWVGSQQFSIEVPSATTNGNPARFTIATQVTLPNRVVVALQTLPRNTVILASDVQLQYTQDDKVTKAAASLEEILGKETTSSLRAGAPITARQVREPVLVRKGDIVTVNSISTGIRIQIQAKAIEDGSMGQLITLEKLEKSGKEKKKAVFRARVSDLQEVEVYAGGRIGSR